MFLYPKLTASEQASLPKLIAPPTTIPNKFEDSTHQLFHCRTTDGAMVLKVCNQTTIKKSHFWLGVNHLFAADFPNSLGNIHLTHHFLTQNGTLAVPGFIVASAHRFVLTRFLAGEDLDSEQIADEWVIALANHIVKLHERSYTSWGGLHSPQFAATAWANRLYETLMFMVKQNDKLNAESLMVEVLAQAKDIHETEFVPVMLDLRWDQFRYCQSGDSRTNHLSLIDLDAFVIAPRTLELVLLEYVLTPTQFALFKQHYMQTHHWPDFTRQKPCYQLLLFLMNILGETNLEKWMKRV